MSFLGLTALAHAQVVTEQALAAYDYYVRDYNVVTFGNLTLNGTHTDAGIAVGGNLTVGGSVISMQSSASTNPALYVNGQITLAGNAQINRGFVSTPNLSNSLTWTYDPQNNQNQRSLTNGTYTLSYNTQDAQTYVDPRTVAAPTGWNWSTAQSALINASSTLASATANGTANISGQTLTFTSNGSGIVVFNLDASKIVNGIYDINGDGFFDQNNERLSNIQANLAADQYFVVNVLNATSADGSKVLFDGVNNFSSGTNNDQLLWNIIPDSNSGTADILTLGTNFYGSILAPLVDVNSNNRYLNGQFVGNSLVQTSAEIHYAEGYSAPVSFSPVPEPSTYAIIASALCAAGFVWHRRRLAASSRSER
ncbi:MAG TPA: collagen-binding domain-containing protein [Acidobacteriota bacterium]|nr:collagen-binding domain-containing protein [Acidobacteriota bacterium]